MAARYIEKGRKELDWRVRRARDTLSVTLQQRCFYLFAGLLLVLMGVPFLEDSPGGRIALVLLNMSVMVAAIFVLGRGLGALLIGLLLALPAVAFMVMGQLSQWRGLVITSNCFAAAFYFATVSYLLTYSLRRDVLTMDKLYGAAAGFLMLGALWSYFYVILLWFYPGALTLNGTPVGIVPPSTMLYFSFATLTSTGMSDLMPVHPVARILCTLEMVTGVLFITVLIARLAGSYPPRSS